MLALVRKIPQAHEHVNKGNWDRDLFRGYQLCNKTIGLIGLGRIGRIVAQYATSFGMQVHYFDPNVNDSSFVKNSTLEELVSTSDIVSLHIHLKQDTQGLVSSSLLREFKHGAFLINTSRGKIIDENAVVDALSTNLLGGVAVDVLESELSNIHESPLWEARNRFPILITPHIGGATYDAMWSCEEFIVDFVDNDCW